MELCSRKSWDAWGHQKLEEARKDFSQSLWRDHGPADTLVLDFCL